ncbi:hypothetical protein P8452_61362 [Trifolium repens]|nr:hypothetical protein P8452_61362 [Trifolium repens]
MQDEFEMSMMGELKFFLGIQINQGKDGTYIHKSKHTKELLKKFNLEDCKIMSTTMHPTSSLGKEEIGSKVDQKLYRGTIDIQFIDTDHQWADIFTKPLAIERFDFIKKNLNMHFISEEN